MSFEKFEEWFAICDPNDEDNFYPGRLIFDPNNGIKLLTIDQSALSSTEFAKIVESDVINGLLDYQRPTVLVNNFIGTQNFGSIGINTKYMRKSYIITTNHIIKNIHLKDVNDKVFLDLRITLPALKAWLAWKMLKNNIEDVFSDDFSELKISTPIIIEHEYKDGTSFKAEAFVTKGASDNEANYKIEPETSLHIKFSSAVTFERVQTVTKNLDTYFSFLIGCRLRINPFYMLTSIESTWNEKLEKLIAESYFVPAWKRQEKPPYISARMFIKDNTPIELPEIIERCLDDENEDLLYWMGLINAYHMNDLNTIEYFFEIVGCLENIDIKIFGEKLGGKKLHLIKRLERLLSGWKVDEFRGGPDFKKIVSLRNKKAHGKSGLYTIEDVKMMSIFGRFLTGLAIYHILKICKFPTEDIARGFMRSPHRFGLFVPEKFLS